MAYNGELEIALTLGTNTRTRIAVRPLSSSSERSAGYKLRNVVKVNNDTMLTAVTKLAM